MGFLTTGPPGYVFYICCQFPNFILLENYQIMTIPPTPPRRTSLYQNSALLFRLASVTMISRYMARYLHMYAYACLEMDALSICGARAFLMSPSKGCLQRANSKRIFGSFAGTGCRTSGSRAIQHFGVRFASLASQHMKIR